MAVLSTRMKFFLWKMTNLQIHDTFEVEEKSELTTVVKDDIQVETELNRIWSQSEKTRYIIAICADINLTDEDIISLKGKNWLTDQVMDSYIGAIAEAETDKVMRIPTSTMTAIVEGSCLQNMT